MAKCTRCGKKGFFLKLENGLCNNCVSLIYHETELSQLDSKKQEIERSLAELNSQLSDQQALFDKIAAEAESSGIEQAKAKMAADQEAADRKLEDINRKCDEATAAFEAAKAGEEKAIKATASSMRKVEKGRNLVMAIDHAIRNFDSPYSTQDVDTEALVREIEEYVSPTFTLDLQCLSMKDLRKRYRQNEKHIEETLEKYKGRYTTKANITIYKLMVIALKAELQNILYGIKYGKLEDALSSIKEITSKYYSIVTDGNQHIAPTMKKFIGEIDFFFQEAVKIEYEYYVQKERAKEEQRAIREQMRQEAEDRRALEAEKKKIEREESKFQGQIAQLQEQLQNTAESGKISQLEARLAELTAQLSAVKEKKEEITTLQNGKAGNVYVISNLGSFGENVFKIGMTRRSEPQQRVDELGDASVPFPFDVHSFIFSDDAVALENKIHKILNNQRVNKVNLRKEFFHISLDDLESLVAELAPTAEFKRTMLAEQYRQSLSIDNVTDIVLSSSNDEDEE